MLDRGRKTFIGLIINAACISFFLCFPGIVHPAEKYNFDELTKSEDSNKNSVTIDSVSKTSKDAVERHTENFNAIREAKRKAIEQQIARENASPCYQNCKSRNFECEAYCTGLSDRKPNWLESSNLTKCQVDCSIANDACRKTCW
jgi:hypothetical protein